MVTHNSKSDLPQSIMYIYTYLPFINDTLSLQDVNDETPTFKSASYVAEIGENSPRATPILFLGGNIVPEVFDHDSGTNGTFQLFLEGDQGIFEVRNILPLNFSSFFIVVVGAS